VGYPPHCTGLVSGWVVDRLEAPGSVSVAAWFKGLRLRYGGYESIIEPAGGVYKLDRVKLEEELARHVEDLGARILLETRVSRVTPSGVVEAVGGGGRYDLVILAEGVHGRLRSRLGVRIVHEHVIGLNAHYRAGEVEGLIVDFTPSLHQGLFSWLLEVGDEVLAGTGAPGNVKVYLERVEEAYNLHERTRIYGGKVLLGPPVRHPVIGRVILTGDAGGLTKPFTGGGLYPSTKAAWLAYKGIKSGLEPVEAWSIAVHSVSRELRRQYRVMGILRKNTSLMGEVIKALSESRLDKAVSGEISYDEHHKAVIAAMRHPLRAAKFLAYMLYRHPLDTVKLATAILSSLIA